MGQSLFAVRVSEEGLAVEGAFTHADAHAANVDGFRQGAVWMIATNEEKVGGNSGMIAEDSVQFVKNCWFWLWWELLLKSNYCQVLELKFVGPMSVRQDLFVGPIRSMWRDLFGLARSCN